MGQEDIQNIEEYLDNYKKEIINTKNELSLSEFPTLTDELFSIYERIGSRLEYEAVYFTRRKYVATYGLLAIIHHKNHKLDKNLIMDLEWILKEICKEEFWGLPAHVNRIEDKHWRISIDLFAAETASTLSEIVFELKDVLSSEIIGIVKENVLKRVLIPFYQSECPYSSWEVAKHNWSAVCGGSIGVATLHLLQLDESIFENFNSIGAPSKEFDYEQSQIETIKNQCMNRICTCLSHYMKGYHEDGVCMEGLLYFTYGMTYYVSFGELLRENTSGRIDILHTEMCRKIAKFQESCYFTGGRTISFSDGNSSENYRFGLTAKLCMRFDDVPMPNIQQAASYNFDPCYRFLGLHRDYVWGIEYLEYKKKKYKNQAYDNSIAKQGIDIKGYGRQRVFPMSQWCICESENQVGFGVKGGHNNEPHNHNDVGSFLYVVKGEMLLTDLGAGEYTKEYFGDGRFDILCNRSISHNVPIINGTEQGDGRNYSANRFEVDEDGKIDIEFSGAYETEIIEELHRSLVFGKKDGILYIEDHFIKSKLTTSIVENLVTQYEPKVEGNIIYVQGEQSSLKIEVHKSFDFIGVVKEKHKNHSGIEEVLYRIEITLPMMGDEKEAISRMVIIPLIDIDDVTYMDKATDKV